MTRSEKAKLLAHAREIVGGARRAKVSGLHEARTLTDAAHRMAVAARDVVEAQPEADAQVREWTARLCGSIAGVAALLRDRDPAGSGNGTPAGTTDAGNGTGRTADAGNRSEHDDSILEPRNVRWLTQSHIDAAKAIGIEDARGGRERRELKKALPKAMRTAYGEGFDEETARRRRDEAEDAKQAGKQRDAEGGPA